MKRHHAALLMGASLVFLTACGSGDNDTTHAQVEPAADSVTSQVANVDTDRIKTASAGEEWLSYGGTYDEQRHSSLTQVNTENVADLGVAWTYELSTNRGVEATPIVVDGVMYVTSSWSIVHALDAKTGEELWVYDPDVDRSVGVNACCDVVNRGVAVYEGKVFVGVIDGRLEAVDAETGERIWSKVTVDQSKPYTITGAPRVVNGRVMIGNSGAELGVRGYLSAYDTETGEKVWRFYTTPNPEKQPDGEVSDAVYADFANETWGDEGYWVSDGGGGTVWDSIVYDDVNDQIIFGVGNGSPWNQDFRDPTYGDNFFLSSIVAVDAATGEYKWHFQTTPGENWDYTATQTIILADLPLGEDGAPRRVAMQAPKNGFFYVVDAATGEFISGDPYVPVSWATGLDETGRPIEVPTARYTETLQQQTPGAYGGHNWHPMAFNPDEGLALIPAHEIPSTYVKDILFESKPSAWNTGSDFSAGLPPIGSPAVAAFLKSTLKGRLIAWDPVARAPRWTVEHDNAWNGGVLSTAGGLVFQGKLGGDFTAYDAGTGEKLWTYNLKSGAAAGPGTYEIDGEQYIAIATGWGSAFSLVAGFAYDETVPAKLGKVVTFKLGGTGEIADVDLPSIDKTPKAEQFGDMDMIAAGGQHFGRNCAVCHGVLGISSGVLPDLRWSMITGNSEAFKGVVIDGNLAENGMVSFAKFLTPEDVEAIRAYLIAQGHAANTVEGAEE